MKKNYKDLEYEVVRFEEEDVITASGLPCDCDGIVAVEPDECPELMCECISY